MIASCEPAELDRMMAEGVVDWDLITNHALGVARKVARRTVEKYPWISIDDLQQDLLLRLQKWVADYDPSHVSTTSWSKYLYHKMSFYALDLLRKEDPLGIRWPQRKHYPEWFRLGDSSDRIGTDSAFVSACDVLEKIEDPDQWQQDLERVDAWARSNIESGRIRPAVHDESEPGVLRAKRLPFWDRRLNRVKFRKGSSLRVFIQQRKCEMTDTVQGDRVEAKPTVQALLNVAGKAGLPTVEILKQTGKTKAAVQSSLLRLRRAGEVYIVGTTKSATGSRQDLYALAEFWPDGPPPIPSAGAKMKPAKLTKTKKSTCQATVAGVKSGTDVQHDLLTLARALANLRSDSLKSQVLELIETAALHVAS